VIDPELAASHGFEPWQSDPEFLLAVFRAFPHFCKASLTLVNQALTNALFFTVLHKNASKAYHTYVALPVKVGVGERSLLASRGAAGAIHKLMPFEVAAFSVLGRRELPALHIGHGKRQKIRSTSASWKIGYRGTRGDAVTPHSLPTGASCRSEVRFVYPKARSCSI
jgi:hypothetical protein